MRACIIPYIKNLKIRIIKAGLIYTSTTIKKAPKILCASKKYIAKKLINKPNREGIEYLPFWWLIVMKLSQFYLNLLSQNYETIFKF